MLTYILLISAYLLGLVASFQPCLFPILPTFVAQMTSEDNKKINSFLASLLVTVGIMIVFITLGILSQSVIGYFANNYLFFRTTQGIILIVLSILLIMGTTIHFTLFDRMSSGAGNLIDKIENPYLLSLLTGLLFTLLAAPCAFVLFGTIFALIAEATIFEAIIVMMIFSVGAGTPFFIISGVLPSIKDRIIANRQNIQKSMTLLSGIIILLVGIYLTLSGMKLLPAWMG